MSIVDLPAVATILCRLSWFELMCCGAQCSCEELPALREPGTAARTSTASGAAAVSCAAQAARSRNSKRRRDDEDDPSDGGDTSGSMRGSGCYGTGPGNTRPRSASRSATGDTAIAAATNLPLATESQRAAAVRLSEFPPMPDASAAAAATAVDPSRLPLLPARDRSLLSHPR